MYMPHPHNRKEWSTCRAKYNYYCKEKYKAKKNRKYEADSADPPGVTKTPAIDPGKSTGPPAWEFNNVRNTTTRPDNGAKYKWCKLHSRKKKNGYRMACMLVVS